MLHEGIRVNHTPAWLTDHPASVTPHRTATQDSPDTPNAEHSAASRSGASEAVQQVSQVPPERSVERPQEVGTADFEYSIEYERVFTSDFEIEHEDDAKVLVVQGRSEVGDSERPVRCPYRKAQARPTGDKFPCATAVDIHAPDLLVELKDNRGPVRIDIRITDRAPHFIANANGIVEIRIQQLDAIARWLSTDDRPASTWRCNPLAT